MKKNLHIILTSILIPIIIYFILEFFSTSVYCEELSGYYYDDFKVISGFIKYIFFLLGLFGSGVLAFYLLKKYVPAFLNRYVQVAYIVLLWGIAFYPMFRTIIQNHNNASLVSSLCNKTTGTIMHVKSTNITYNEYKYLQGKLVLLPDISSQSDSIQIDYYHDGFLPDFLLNIRYRVPVNDPTETNDKRWFEKSRDSLFKWIEYSDIMD